MLLVVWLVEREARPAGVVVVMVVTVEEEGMDGSNEEGGKLGTELMGLEREGPKGL